MLPLILAVVGGYFIGDSMKDKKVYADGGEVLPPNWTPKYKIGDIVETKEGDYTTIPYKFRSGDSQAKLHYTTIIGEIIEISPFENDWNYILKFHGGSQFTSVQEVKIKGKSMSDDTYGMINHGKSIIVGNIEFLDGIALVHSVDSAYTAYSKERQDEIEDWLDGQSVDWLVVEDFKGDVKFDDYNNFLSYGSTFEEGGIMDAEEISRSNQEMVSSQVKAIKHHADELSNIVTDKTPIEAWVVAKVERSETDLSDVTHYLDGLKYSNGGMMAKGGKVKVGDILTANTGVKVRVAEYDPKFGGRVRVERLDEYATGKQPSQFMALSKFNK